MFTYSYESLISLVVSVDVKHHVYLLVRVPYKPYGFSGRKAHIYLLVRVSNKPYGFCGRKAQRLLTRTRPS